MFTGIVQHVGGVVAVEARDGDITLRIDAGPLPVTRLDVGASVAVNGVCLTVAGGAGSTAAFDVSRETLARTTLGGLAMGGRVNLEPALTLNEPLGGHLVAGHVDGVAEVVAVERDARSTRMAFRLPADLMRYIARKGSLCVDGVSLTVNGVSGDRAEVNVVPYTLQSTIMGGYATGTRVNIEVDLIARYLERLLEGRSAGPQHRI